MATHKPSTKTDPPLSIGTTVRFDIAQGMAVGEGVIRASDYDDGWFYRLDVTAGDHADEHRNEAGELWVGDFEVTPKELSETQK